MKPKNVPIMFKSTVSNNFAKNPVLQLWIIAYISNYFKTFLLLKIYIYICIYVNRYIIYIINWPRKYECSLI